MATSSCSGKRRGRAGGLGKKEEKRKTIGSKHSEGKRKEKWKNDGDPSEGKIRNKALGSDPECLEKGSAPSVVGDFPLEQA